MGTIISWTNETWNPTTGCTKISEGCRNCYAERISLKFGYTRKPWTSVNEAENVTCHPERLKKPYTWKKPSRVFVNSMSDLFHPAIPDIFIAQVFKVMNDTPQHTYQVLTKRPERAAAWGGTWGPNIWMGVSVEDKKAVARLDTLRACPAIRLFVSFEPLISDLGPIDLTGFSWAIVGGESGPGYRPMNHAWARAIRDECLRLDIAYFFKQDAAFKTETRPWLVHENGSRWQWQQYPGQLTPPVCLDDPAPTMGLSSTAT